MVCQTLLAHASLVNAALPCACHAGWVRALGCPDLGGQRQGSLRFEPANGGASSHWAFNTWFSADRPCEKVKAQLPRSFREAHQVRLAIAVVLKGLQRICWHPSCAHGMQSIMVPGMV